MATGIEAMGLFNVTKIHAWEDVRDSIGACWLCLGARVTITFLKFGHGRKTMNNYWIIQRRWGIL